jgi:arginase
MKLALILASYDSGHYRTGFGAGPQALIDGGLAEALAGEGHDVSVEDIGRVGDRQGREIATGFAVCDAVSARVQAAVAGGRFPVVLAGNCFTASGAVAGEAADQIIWFDQHGDINTPETSGWGFLDGMALAVALGLCWQPMAGKIPGFKPIDPRNCILVDARDLDPEEVDLIKRLNMAHVSCDGLAVELDRVPAARGKRTHLHLDLDVHDAQKLRVNRYATAGGPDVQTLREALAVAASRRTIAGVSMTAYDPQFDPDSKVPAVAAEHLAQLLAAVEASNLPL